MIKKQKDYPSIRDIFYKVYGGNIWDFIKGFLNDPGGFIIPVCRRGFYIPEEIIGKEEGENIELKNRQPKLEEHNLLCARIANNQPKLKGPTISDMPIGIEQKDNER